MNEKLNKKLVKCISAIWAVMFSVTIFLLLSKQMIWDVYTTKPFTTENAGYLILGLFLVVILFALNSHFGNQIQLILIKYERILLTTSLMLLLIWNLYACYGGYFYSGWDAGVIHNTVFNELNYEYDQLDNIYFSWYPNNKLLVWIFTFVLKVARKFGIQTLDFVLVAFQIILGVFSMWLVYKIIFEMLHSYKVAWMAYLSSCFFVGVSPWYIVAYSDATGIVFPLLIIRIYQLVRGKEKMVSRILLWILMGFIAMIGYLIKPQTAIAFIAVVIVEIILAVNDIRLNKLKISAIRIASGLVGVLLCSLIYSNLIIPSLHFKDIPDKTMGMQHYFMMGLNESTDGVYSEDDVAFTRSFESNEERNSADMHKAKQRLQTYGAKGLLRHICRKQIVNYNDGTFGWGCEGNSFIGDPEWANNRASNLVRSYIKPEGSNYNKFISAKQTIWITILFFCCFTVFYRKTELSNEAEMLLFLMMLSVLGLTIFELLFEARARYLFCYSPIYVILAVLGMRNVFRYANIVMSYRK